MNAQPKIKGSSRFSRVSAQSSFAFLGAGSAGGVIEYLPAEFDLGGLPEPKEPVMSKSIIMCPVCLEPAGHGPMLASHHDASGVDCPAGNLTQEQATDLFQRLESGVELADALASIRGTAATPAPVPAPARQPGWLLKAVRKVRLAELPAWLVENTTSDDMTEFDLVMSSLEGGRKRECVSLRQQELWPVSGREHGGQPEADTSVEESASTVVEDIIPVELSVDDETPPPALDADAEIASEPLQDVFQTTQAPEAGFEPNLGAEEQPAGAAGQIEPVSIPCPVCREVHESIPFSFVDEAGRQLVCDGDGVMPADIPAAQSSDELVAWLTARSLPVEYAEPVRAALKSYSGLRPQLQATQDPDMVRAMLEYELATKNRPTLVSFIQMRLNALSGPRKRREAPVAAPAVVERVKSRLENSAPMQITFPAQAPATASLSHSSDEQRSQQEELLEKLLTQQAELARTALALNHAGLRVELTLKIGG